MNSKELLAEKEKGAQILHNGAPVEFEPRRKGDREPWVYYEFLGPVKRPASTPPCESFKAHRYPASACQAVFDG